MAGEVVLLSGGTGGAKLARGLLDVLGPDRLTIVANTGDDCEVYGVHVSPDADLITYWLADRIDARGYGIEGDTWEVMDALERGGREVWFHLGDRDLSMCLIRTELMAAGATQTEAHAAVCAAMGVEVAVLPMCDSPMRTRVTARGQEMDFQRFMIVEGAAGPIDDVAVVGDASVRATDAVLEAIADAETVIIGPSNPVVSIGPILSLPGMSEALSNTAASVVAVSPFVGGKVLKGPTLAFCEYAGIEPSATGLIEAYRGLCDGIVSDEMVGALPTACVATLMDTRRRREQLARDTLEFAGSLGARPLGAQRAAQ